MRQTHGYTVVFAHHLCPRSLYIITYRTVLLPYRSAPPQRKAKHEHAFRQSRNQPLGPRRDDAFTMIGAGIGAVLSAIATWPTKRDSYKALDQLSDKQLADIGLARGEISRVFEPGFALQAANDGALPAGRAA